MSLKDWVEHKWLSEHTPNSEEIQRLLDKSAGDLEQCVLDKLSPDWRFIIAYHAALGYAIAALAASGYRALAVPGHQENIIESLRFTLNLKYETVEQLQAFRTKCGAARYEMVGSVSSRMAQEMIEIAHGLQTKTLEWLKQYHPNLLER